jgi:hypothetical protein
MLIDLIDLTDLTDLTDNLENIICRNEVSELTNLIDKVG